MAKSKSRTLAKKSKGFQFKWWMAVIGIAIVAGVGLVVLRFSHAGGRTYPDYVVKVVGCAGGPGGSFCTLQLKSSGKWELNSKYPLVLRYNSNNTVTCAIMTSYGFKNMGIMKDNPQPGRRVDITESKTISKSSIPSANGAPDFEACK